MDQDLTRLEQLLDQAIDNAQCWNEVCDEVVKMTGANGAILVPATPSFRGVWMSCSSRLGATLDEYIDGGWHLDRSEEHTSELQSRENLVCRLLLEKKNTIVR